MSSNSKRSLIRVKKPVQMIKVPVIHSSRYLMTRMTQKNRVELKKNANIDTMNPESKQSGIMEEYYFTCVNIDFLINHVILYPI